MKYMRRYIYSNLLKIIFFPLFLCIIIVSFIYFICFLSLDKIFNLPSLLIFISCCLLWFILIIGIIILNKRSKNYLFVEKDKIIYKGKTIYKDSLTMKYFKFHISLIAPNLVIPKLHINGNGLSVICYLSKKEIKKLENFGYEIRWI